MLKFAPTEARLMTNESTNISLGTRPSAWIAIVVSASTVLSYGLACAVPFAALAAVAALTLTRRDALLLVAPAWLANQAVGFGLLSYPWDFETFEWGLALLAVSAFATLGAGLCASRFGAVPRIAGAIFVFLAAFAIYEGLLLIVSVVAGSGTGAFEPATVARIFAINAAACAALLVASRLRLPHTREQPAAVRSVA
jgi:hypothetical protein